MTVGYDQEGDVAKLPKWARKKIEILEMRLREAKEKMEGMAAKVGDLNTEPPAGTLVWGSDDDWRAVSRPYDRARFVMKRDGGGARYIDVAYDRDMHEGSEVIEIRGSEMIEIYPWSSNGIKVKLRR